MVKKLLQDVLPPIRKTIRHIPVPDERKTREETPRKEPATELPIKPPRRKKTGRGRRLAILLGIFALLAGGIFFVAQLFTNAKITVTPKMKAVAVEAVLQSKISPENGVLGHQIVTATTTLSENIPATEKKEIARKASGTIVIYNDYSAASQRLIKNTRFEAPDGRIYRIDTSVVVPGQRTENGKTVPGSAQALVYADAAGAEYNMKLTDFKGDFTVPGFKGTPRYENFYARLQTDITGGYEGLANVVDPSLISSATLSLKNRAKDELWNTLTTSVPDTHVLFPSNFFVEYSVTTDDSAEKETATVSVTAIAHAVVYDAVEFSTMLAKRVIPDHSDDELVLVSNIQSLTINPKPTDPARPWEDEIYLAEIRGSASFIWQYNENALKEALSGTLKKDASKVFSNFPAIEKAEISLKPLWRKSFPQSKDDIEIYVSTVDVNQGTE